MRGEQFGGAPGLVSIHRPPPPQLRGTEGAASRALRARTPILQMRMSQSIPTRVLFVCLGNICRSPLAEAVFRHKVRERGVESEFQIDSAGTSG